jgi:putative membrane protein
MNGLAVLRSGILTMLLSIFSLHLFAQTNEDTKNFLDDALMKSAVKIENARVALEKSTSQEVKAYSNHIISDHEKFNADLRKVADDKGIALMGKDDLRHRASAYVIKVRESNYFDIAYANNQVVAHQQTLRLLKAGADGSDKEIQAFAKANLRRMEQHLQMAEQLVAATSESKTDIHQDREGKTYDTHQHLQDLHEHDE